MLETMKSILRIACVIILIVGSAAGQEKPALPVTPALKQVASVELPKVEGRIDHMAFDVKRRRLCVAALGNDSVEVLDVAAMKHLRSISGLAEPQGLAYLAEWDRIVVANGKSGMLDVFDGEKFAKIASVKIGEDADNVRYVEKTKSLIVGYGSGGLAIVDPKEWRVTGTIAVGGHPEGFEVIPSFGNLGWVNVPSQKSIVVIDVPTRKVIPSSNFNSSKNNYPMTFEPSYGEVFVGSRSPNELLIYDIEGTLKFDLPLSADVDDLCVDPYLGRLYASCGSGTIDVFEFTKMDEWKLREKIPTAPGARTCLFVPEEKKLFLAVPARGGKPAEIRVFEAVR